MADKSKNLLNDYQVQKSSIQLLNKRMYGCNSSYYFICPASRKIKPRDTTNALSDTSLSNTVLSKLTFFSFTSFCSFRANLFLKFLNFFSTFLSMRPAIPFKHVTYFVLFFLFFSQFVTSDCYVFTSEDSRQSYLHKSLVGRQRREVQREILSILGLNHRPRVHRPIETSSAPLYMLGLYSSASHSYDEEMTLDSSRNAAPTGNMEYSVKTEVRNQRGPIIFPGQFNTNQRDPINLYQTTSNLKQYIEDSGILTNEIGVFESGGLQDQGFESHLNPSSTDVATEKLLTKQSDMIISFINTKKQQVLDEPLPRLIDFHGVLRRHRGFYFDISQVAAGDRLAAARFRLYKERSDYLLGSLPLRVHVYRTTIGYDGRTTVVHLGTRLTGSDQEGWLVFDVTSTLSDWIAHPRSNLGLKVTVATTQGRYLKPTKSGIVGRRGSSTKQAFVVAFFNQDEPDVLRPNIRHRFRRNVNFGSDGMDNETDSQLHELQDDEEDYDDDDDDEDEDVGDDEDDNNTPAASDDKDSRTMTKRKTKSRKKGRKRKKPRKNSSKKKQQPTEPCQKKKFHVDFKDLGWHTWIIAPKAYKAYQCYGKCSFPLNAGLNVTNHAIVQSLVHVRLKPLNIPEPCCAPSKLEPLDILFFNDQTKVIYKKYRDMVVSACGCH